MDNDPDSDVSFEAFKDNNEQSQLIKENFGAFDGLRALCYILLNLYFTGFQ